MAYKKKIKKRSSITIKFAKILIYILSLFFFQEIAFRISFPLPEIKNFNRITYQRVGVTDHKVNYVRNIKMLWKSSLDTDADFFYNLNYYGFRDKNWNVEKSGNKKRIMFVGDSFIEGMMADEDETIPSSFRNSLNVQNEDYEVMNFGMMGIGVRKLRNCLTEEDRRPSTSSIKTGILLEVMAASDEDARGIPHQTFRYRDKVLQKVEDRLADLEDIYNFNLKLNRHKESKRSGRKSRRWEKQNQHV